MLHHVEWQIVSDSTANLGASKFSIKQVKNITLRMEALCTLETPVIRHVHQLIQRNIKDDVKFHQQSCEKFQTRINKYFRMAFLQKNTLYY